MRINKYVAVVVIILVLLGLFAIYPESGEVSNTFDTMPQRLGPPDNPAAGLWPYPHPYTAAYEAPVLPL